MSYFKTKRTTREELRHEAHGELVNLVAAHIAGIKDATKREITTEAFTMYMSIKIGDTKREEIVAGYMEAIADASAK